MSTDTRSLKCADQFAALASSVAGTAPRCTSLLVVEVPLPWPRDIAADPRLTDIAEVCEETGHRLQAVVPAMTATCLRALRFTRESGSVVGFTRIQRSFEPHELQAETIALLRAPVGAAPDPSADVTDVLVCAHGIRDRCCGSAGTRLVIAAESALDPSVRTWRTSHLGGHRFAPTAMTLPDGRAWASLDEATLVRIASRSVRPSEVAHLDRGSVMVGTPYHQVADSAVLAHVDDWAWTTTPRTFHTHAEDSGDVRAVDVAAADGRRWLVSVEFVRRLPIPECGVDLGGAAKFADELRAVEVLTLA